MALRLGGGLRGGDRLRRRVGLGRLRFRLGPSPRDHRGGLLARGRRGRGAHLGLHGVRAHDALLVAAQELVDGVLDRHAREPEHHFRTHAQGEGRFRRLRHLVEADHEQFAGLLVRDVVQGLSLQLPELLRDERGVVDGVEVHLLHRVEPARHDGLDVQLDLGDLDVEVGVDLRQHHEALVAHAARAELFIHVDDGRVREDDDATVLAARAHRDASDLLTIFGCHDFSRTPPLSREGGAKWVGLFSGRANIVL